MKRQSSCSSSISRRQQKSIGCMSAISNLLFQRHSRSKLLTSGKKKQQEKEGTKAQKQNQQEVISVAEMGRSKLVESGGYGHGVVAKLMGLDSIPAAEAEAETTATATAIVDKRKRLIGALEKCDEDLKALQKIIEVVKTSVSVGAQVQLVNHRGTQVTQQIQPKKMKKKKYKRPGEEEISVSVSGGGCVCLLDRLRKEVETVEYGGGRSSEDDAVQILWRSKDTGMLQCVDQVCRDIAWGERREIGIIGVALQNYIYRDLIDEIVKEMGSSSSTYALPFEACRRGLTF